MLLEARQSLLHKFRQKQLPNMGLLFLNLKIRRKFLLEDSLREVSLKNHEGSRLAFLGVKAELPWVQVCLPKNGELENEMTLAVI